MQLHQSEPWSTRHCSVSLVSLYLHYRFESSEELAKFVLEINMLDARCSGGPTPMYSAITLYSTLLKQVEMCSVSQPWIHRNKKYFF